MTQLFDGDSAVPSSETYELRDDGRSASAALEGEVDAILDKALGGGEITVDEGARLFDATGDELTPLPAAADRSAISSTVVKSPCRALNSAPTSQ